VSTDRNCSRDTVMEVQSTVLRCLDRETYRNLHQLTSIKLSNNIKDDLCQIFGRTFGKCLKLTWLEPDCFSTREASFLRETFAKIYIESLDVAQEISDNDYLSFSLSDCARQVLSGGTDTCYISRVNIIIVLIVLLIL